MKVMVLGSNPVSAHFSYATWTCGLTFLCLTFSIGKMERGMDVSTYSQPWFILSLSPLFHPWVLDLFAYTGFDKSQSDSKL